MKSRSHLALLALLALILSITGITGSHAGTRSVFYETTRGWNVNAVYDTGSSQFSFCSASAVYRDHTTFLISRFANGNWVISFFNDAWSESGKGSFRVDLIVDGKTIDRTTATWVGKGAIINFGQEVEKLVSIMRGYTLTIVSRTGSSKFSLEGSAKATWATLDCWKLHANSGGANPGAFGAPAQAQNSLSTSNNLRLITLEAATAYLGNYNVPYKILPESENFFKNLPVNWTYGRSSVGGMLIGPSGTNYSGEQALVDLLQDQTKACTGKSAIDRQAPTMSGDVKVYRARGVCQTDKDAFEAVYTVADGEAGIILIVELTDLTDIDAYPTLKSGPEGVQGLPTRFIAR